MRWKFTPLIVMLTAAFIAFSVTSCKKNNVKKIEVDNSFALSVFNDDSITMSDLLDLVDSTWRNIVRVAPDGSMSVVLTSDTIKNVISGADLLNNIDDLVIEEYTTVVVPDLDVPDSLLIIKNLIENLPPGTPIPPFEYRFSFDTIVDLNHVASIPFNVDNFQINEVVMKSGVMDVNLDLYIDPSVSFNVRMMTEEVTKGEEHLDIMVENHEQLNFDLADWTVKPFEDSVRFSAEAEIQIEPMLINENTPLNDIKDLIDRIVNLSGEKDFSLVGGITGMSIKSVDGIVDIPVQRFRGSVDSLAFHIHQLSGDLWIKTPSLQIEYMNTFGFNVAAAMDSLYYQNDNEETVNLIADSPIGIVMEPTMEGEYKDIDLSGALVPFIEVLGGVDKFGYSGDAVITGAQGSTVTEASHIDLTTNIEMPVSCKINEARFMDTVTFSVGEVGVSNFLQEIEFKFRVNNGLPLQLAMQVYTCDSTFIDDPDRFITDSLFKPNAQGIMNNVIEASFNGEPVKSTILMTVTGETMDSFAHANKLIIKMTTSTGGNEAVIRSTDMIGLGIGVKTKTTNVDLNNL